MSRSETIRFLVLRSLGNFLVLLALYGVVSTFGPALKFEMQYQIIRLRGIHFIIQAESKVSPSQQRFAENATSSNGNFQKATVSAADTVSSGNTSHATPGFADILAGSKEQILTPIDPLFSILIPKLGIDEQVVPNVDPNNPTVYLPVLQHAVAHAKGTVFPGDPGTTYLFAHSADNWWDIEHYNAVFYTLNNLSLNDQIVIFFDNRRYTYVVSKKLIADPRDITYLTSNHAGPQRLVLQTCWPPGTSWKRLYIIATPKKI